MEYSGWSLMDNIIVVLNKNESGFVVDSNNKKQLETALRWAGKEARQVEFKNEGFTVEILRAASGSSQGGKLSFWTCKITKDGITFKVGIDSNMLLDCIRNTTIVNGIIQEDVVFARNFGLGLLHKGMDQYKRALNDMKTKDKLKKKTSKHVIGRNYVTINEDDVYLGNAYNWWNCVEKSVDYVGGYRTRVRILNYSLKDEPTEIKMTLRKSVLIKYLKGKNNLKSYIDNLIEGMNELGEWEFKSAFPNISKERLPSRAEGELRIVDDTTTEDWDRLFNTMREYILKKYTVDRYVDGKNRNRVDYEDFKYWLITNNNKEATVPNDEVEALFCDSSNSKYVYNKLSKIVK